MQVDCPNWCDGFAQSPDESHAPGQWHGEIGAWAPLLGVQGLTLYDHSGYANHGAFVGGVTWVTSGNTGYALSFNGTTGRITIPVSVQTLFPLSFSAWFKTSVTAGVQPLITVQRATNVSMTRLILYQSKVQAQTQESGGGSNLVASVSNYPLSVWAHACAVFYSTSSFSIFLNGKFEANSTATIGQPTLLTATHIGGTVAVDEWMNGLIDDVRVFSKALTDAEVWQLYVNGLDRYRLRRRMFIDTAAVNIPEDWRACEAVPNRILPVAVAF